MEPRLRRPDVKTSLPNETGFCRFSRIRMESLGPTSATTMRTALEPTSMTAMMSLLDRVSGMGIIAAMRNGGHPKWQECGGHPKGRPSKVAAIQDFCEWYFNETTSRCSFGWPTFWMAAILDGRR